MQTKIIKAIIISGVILYAMAPDDYIPEQVDDVMSILFEYAIRKKRIV